MVVDVGGCITWNAKIRGRLLGRPPVVNFIKVGAHDTFTDISVDDGFVEVTDAVGPVKVLDSETTPPPYDSKSIFEPVHQVPSEDKS